MEELMFSLILLSLFLWMYVFQCINKDYSHIPRHLRGGGGSPSAPTPPPAAPTPQETSAQAIQAQIDAIPKMLSAQKQYGGQFTELDLENLKKFGPQYAQEGLNLSKQFGEQYSEQMLKEQDILDPSRSAGSRALAEFLGEGPEGLSEDEVRYLEQSARSAAASRGLVDSGFSAKDEINRMFGARQALKDRFLNVALSASGRLPAAQSGGSTINPGNYSTGQLVQNVSPTEIFGAQASNNAMASSIFGTQSNIYGTQAALRGQNMQLVGDIVGGIAGGFGSFAGAGGFAKKAAAG